MARSKTRPARHTHAPADEVTVFLIGMRINKPWRPDAWVPAFTAMRPMVAELQADADSGLLGVRWCISPQGPLLVQYWRSTDDLVRYASSAEHAHRPAWKAFNARARRVPGAVGVWHETFRTTHPESLYVDMPASGLAAALGVEDVTERTTTAAQRLAR